MVNNKRKLSKKGKNLSFTVDNSCIEKYIIGLSCDLHKQWLIDNRDIFQQVPMKTRQVK